MSTKYGLTKDEQTHVRAALQFLRRQLGDWASLAKALHMSRHTLMHQGGTKAVTEVTAFRVARLAGVSVDAVLSGEFPEPGTCPYCGRGPKDDR